MNTEQRLENPQQYEVASATPRRLSEELTGLVAAFSERSVCLREVLEVLHGRAYTLLLFFLALPFCTPIPIPGVSTVFGVVIALIGFRLSLGQKPWLPQKLLNAQLPPRFFMLLLSAGKRLVRILEYFARPRLVFLLDKRQFHHAYGFIILICGLLMLLPLPIPLSNGLPALTVVFLAAAILERDGYFVMAGIGVFLMTSVFFGGLIWGGAELTEWMRGLFGGTAENK